VPAARTQNRQVRSVLVEIQPVLARRRKGDHAVVASPDSFAAASYRLPQSALEQLKSGDLNSESRFESVTSASSIHAVVAGVWALPIALVLLLATYVSFASYCHANPLLVAAYFCNSSHVQTSLPVISALLLVSVSLVCGGWVYLRRQVRQLPIVIATSCASLSLAMAVPVVLLRTPEAPAVVSADLQVSGQGAGAQGKQVQACVLVDVPQRGDYRVESSLNGVVAESVDLKLEPGSRTIRVSFAGRDFRRAVLQSDDLLGSEATLQLRLLLKAPGDPGYRPVRVTEWPLTREVIEPVLRTVEHG
jgi:hypothetical protein